VHFCSVLELVCPVPERDLSYFNANITEAPVPRWGGEIGNPPGGLTPPGAPARAPGSARARYYYMPYNVRFYLSDFTKSLCDYTKSLSDFTKSLDSAARIKRPQTFRGQGCSLFGSIAHRPTLHSKFESLRPAGSSAISSQKVTSRSHLVVRRSGTIGQDTFLRASSACPYFISPSVGAMQSGASGKVVVLLVVLLSRHACALRLRPAVFLRSRWPTLAGRSQWKSSKTCITDEKCDGLYDDDGGLYDDEDDDDAKLAIMDACILRAVRLRSQQPLTRQYKPMAWWLWRQWDGTVLKKTYISMLYIVLVYLGLTLLVAGPKLPAFVTLSVPSLAPHLITANLAQMMACSCASTPKAAARLLLLRQP
jgi:hypothetical protein